MSNNTWPKRLYALDVSRGFASISVVLWHWQHFGFKDNYLPQDFERKNQPLYGAFKLFYENGAMGVEFFFILSGFVFFWLYRESIQNKITNAQTFFIQRFSRLYPLHIFTLLTVVLLQALYISKEGYYFIFTFNDLYHFLLNLGFASHWGLEKGRSFNDPIWSVSIEILLYFVFFVTARLHRGGWLFCMATSVLAGIVYYLFRYIIFEGLALFFIGGLVFHVTSLISYKHYLLKIIIYLVTVLCWSSVIINCYLLDLSSLISDIGIAGNIFILGFPFYILFPLTVCSLALIEIDKGELFKRIAWVGDITYSSYLLHFPLQLIFGLAVSYGVLSFNFYLNPLYLMAYFMILIPLSFIVFIKFEMPMQSIIRKYFLKKSKYA